MFTILSQLRASDSFNIVLFNGGTELWRSSASFATSENIKKGKVFVEKRVKAGGSTNINSALLQALEHLTNTANQQNSLIAGNFPMVLFLTDGDPTAGVTNTKTIRSNIYNANKIKASIFALGFGFRMNFDFLTALSIENGRTLVGSTQIKTLQVNWRDSLTRSARLCYCESDSSTPGILWMTPELLHWSFLSTMRDPSLS